VVESVSTPRAIHVSKIIRARHSDGRIAVPVLRNQAYYARFKHVRGIPSTQDGVGYSLSKLRVLDILIDRLSAAKGRPVGAGADRSNGHHQVSEQQLDAEIARRARQLAETLGGTSGAFATGVFQPGLVVNASA
jgi:hypothetical protein